MNQETPDERRSGLSRECNDHTVTTLTMGTTVVLFIFVNNLLLGTYSVYVNFTSQPMAMYHSLYNT